MLTHKYKQFPTDKIIVDRPDRQRSEIDVEDILPSISRFGILNPITIQPDGRLIAGERRLTAALQLKLPTVPVRLSTELSPRESKMLEFEENMRRKDLPWQDQCKSMSQLFLLFKEDNPEATQKDFADFTGYSAVHVGRWIATADEIAKGNDRVAKAPTMQKAINVVVREKERTENNLMADILDTMADKVSPETPIIHPAESILNESFHDWAPVYEGPKFNLIHMDFPYGIDLQSSDQLQVEGTAHKTYEDSVKTYHALLRTLAEHRHNFISQSAHMVFWFHPKYWRFTQTFFKDHMPEWTFDEVPLVWLKSDNRGIVPDVERRPRRVTEFAMFGWTGDRKIEKLFSNGYAAPKADGAHVSEKPEPVLKYFFSGLVGPHTRLFDPTCGSGSALRAAEGLGAGTVLGLEIDPEYAELARSKLKSSRAIRALAEGV